jgi:hypothetical protein
MVFCNILHFPHALPKVAGIKVLAASWDSYSCYLNVIRIHVVFKSENCNRTEWSNERITYAMTEHAPFHRWPKSKDVKHHASYRCHICDVFWCITVTEIERLSFTIWSKCFYIVNKRLIRGEQETEFCPGPTCLWYDIFVVHTKLILWLLLLYLIWVTFYCRIWKIIRQAFYNVALQCHRNQMCMT